MRILMISDVYFPRINGVSTSIKTFRKELTNLGHEVKLIAPDYRKKDTDNDWIFRIPSRYLPMDPEDRMMKQKYIHLLKDRLKLEKYDIVHIQTPFIAHNTGIQLSRMLNVPRIESYHTHFEECLHHYIPWMPKAITKFSTSCFNRKQCNEVDALIVPSKPMHDILIQQGIKTPIEIIATGIDDTFFKQGNGHGFRERYGIPDNRPVLAHIGRIAYEKNIDFLLHMVVKLRERIPDILLIIAGEGPAENYLRKLAGTLKIENNILFVGYLERSTTLLDCYSAANVFVFSSKVETQGLVLLESMAQGIPVVSISMMGTNDILDAGKGALIANDDTTDFANKVYALLNDAELHRKLSYEANEYARTWSASSFAVKTIELYEKTVYSYRLN